MNLNGRLSYEGNVSGSLGAELVADVEANPSGPATQTLVKIRVGDIIYSIPTGGGGGGTSDYNLLNNKPKINNITLEGELTLSDLGIQEAIDYPSDPTKYLDGEGNFTTPPYISSYNDLSNKPMINGVVLTGDKTSDDLDLSNKAHVNELSGASVDFQNGQELPLLKCIANIEPVQSGSGTPSPDNVRAISGYTAVNVNVAGKNLLDNTLCVERTINGIQRKVNNDGTITITGTSTVMGQWWNSVDNLGVFFKKGTYTISCNEVELYAVFRKAQIVSGTFTLSEDDYLDNAFFVTTVGETYNLRTEPMIRFATESDTFEPYKGSTTTTQLGQTVYGGQLNVLTGELTVTDGYITFDGTESGVSWTDIGTNMRSSILNIENLKSAPKATGANAEAISNYLEKVLKNYSADVTGFYFYDESNIYVKLPKSVLPSADTSGCTQYLQSHNLSICYKLLTPITVQLTPQKVRSILGQNYIEANTGDIDIIYINNVNDPAIEFILNNL